jgi:hypothetical protein
MLAVNEYQRITWGQNLCRIGVLRDGSCFFHALLMETDASYHTLSPKERRTAVVDLRRRVADSLTIQDFSTLRSNDRLLCQDLPAQVSRYRREQYDVPLEEVTRLLSDLEVYAYQLPTPTVAGLKSFIQNFLAFRAYITNPDESVGDELHLLVARILEVDVYLTTTQEDGSMGYIYHNPELAYQGRRSIIVHKVPDRSHWEAVGQFSEQGLVTVFEPEDTVIRQLRKCFEDHWLRLQE